MTLRPSTRRHWPALTFLFALWLAIFCASLWTPPLLDDADATHAQAAQSMARTGDWVTLHVNGVRYLEKAPLPYWIAALSLRVFGDNSFAIHLPLALAALALAALGYIWALQVFDDRTAFYTALFTLTATGVFLFTRIFIPEVVLSLFLCVALYSLFNALAALPCPSKAPSSGPEHRAFAMRSGETPAFSPAHAAYAFWIAAALATLTKGLVTILFLLATALAYFAITHSFTHWRRLRPLTGLLLFLAIAAPWHILAALRNTGAEHGRGFLWFYFVNEHVLRFLGRRQPRDYNKLPGLLYWSLHFVWLFPWSIFVPAAILAGWRNRRSLVAAQTDAQRTVLLLAIYSACVLLFFSLSTNQEYYTFPAYLPLLMLLALALARAESDARLTRWLHASHAGLVVLGAAIASVLGFGLWTSHNLPFNPDIGTALAHRSVGAYTLSMSHFFDLTGSSFAALRLPAWLALLAFAIGPAIAWRLRARKLHLASSVAIALTFGSFLIAAHIALTRFAPLLSSRDFADRIFALEHRGSISPATEVLLYGDQATGSSIPFYLNRSVKLVDGRTTSMYFGSTFPDAPPIFLTQSELLAEWNTGPRKILFVPFEKRPEIDALLGSRSIVLAEESGKQLLTDRPLDPAPSEH